MLRRLAALAALCALAGCGASYTVRRTAPDGSVLEATARSAERAESIEFSFEGDPGGEIKRLVFKKTGAEPVNLTAQTLQSLLGRAAPMPKE